MVSRNASTASLRCEVWAADSALLADRAGLALHLVAPDRIVEAQVAERVVRLVVGRLAQKESFRLLATVASADVRMHAEQGFFHRGGQAGGDAGQGEVVPDFSAGHGMVDEIRRALGQVAVDEPLVVVAGPVKGADGIEDSQETDADRSLEAWIQQLSLWGESKGG
jgi:hypothetical protein